MIVTQDEIEMKDFSVVLPRVIAKLESIGWLLTESTFHGVEFGNADSDVQGIGYIMGDAAEELKTINKALYGHDGEEKAAPETEASEEDGQGQGQENT